MSPAKKLLQRFSEMIKNKQYRINKSEITPNTSLIDVIKQVVGKDAIRWYISQITSDEIII
ncbi:hypothetical protein [Trichodesmium erythraeum]|uniref:hypothetical protein n=1 Tax=Trichodesmium erythraeum TaxID=1206 RepID=UPI0002EC2208|nr:hypothetical protein [Trichodesmium erythraeum GBRTRLIN201]